MQFLSPNSHNNIIYFGDVDDNDVGYINYVHSANEMHFQTNAAVRLSIDGSGNVGIGTDSPATELHVKSTDSHAKLRLEAPSTGEATIEIFNTTTGALSAITTDNNKALAFKVNGTTTAMKILSSGNVGIGVTDPDRLLELGSTGDAWIKVGSTAGTDRAFLIGTDANHRFDIYDETAELYRLSIASGGNVGIGTTVPGDLLHLSSSGHTEMSLDRATTGYDASIKFRTAGTTNWNFGTGITGTESDLTFNDGSDHVLILKSDNSATFAGNVLPSADNSKNLGSASYRWANIYSADVHLSNEGSGGNEVDGTTGNWTIQEGEDDLYLLNRKNGKKYRFKLEEIK